MKHIYSKLLKPLLLLPLMLILFTQCTTPRLSMQNGKQVQQLGVCLYFAPGVPEDFQADFEDALDAYIVRHNNTPHAFKLTQCQDSSSLRIRVDGVSYTNSNQRAAGIALSAVGLFAVPYIMVSSGMPFYAFFYYFPRNQTAATIALTEDLAQPGLGIMNRSYSTGGMFGNDERQRLRHKQKFDKHLNYLFTELETSYRRTSIKKAKLTQLAQVAN
ncbi:hypothetical protein [Pontibacter vulgaris]|uniref:hypothetical protein n=1 Tax=Pontibacter vulgaris TaxID=2905679 RepID=UPI001FA7A4D6|nr:hypothetical protein [Pontibacter vulgaris]